MDTARTHQPDFRPIQYLGSKWRILDQISDAVNSVSRPDRPLVLDLFAGTGVVSRRLARQHPVIASDIQEYSRVISSALLDPQPLDVESLMRLLRVNTTSKPPWLAHLCEWEIQRLSGPEWSECLADDLEAGSLELGKWRKSSRSFEQLEFAAAEISKGQHWTLLSHYGGVFFSYRQASDLDMIAREVWRLEPKVRDTALAALLGTASEVVSSVGGHFAQPVRPRNSDGELKTQQLVNVRNVRARNAVDIFELKLHQFSALQPPQRRGSAIRAPFEEVIRNLPASAGVVYADPPYTREHYSRFYHVLETIALGDRPGISTVNIGGVTAASQGLYRVDRHQSPFSIVSQAPRAFESLFQSLSDAEVSLVLSYSPVPENDKPRARVISIEKLLTLASAHFATVSVVDVPGIRHSKFNSHHQNAPAVDEAEVMIIASNL